MFTLVGPERLRLANTEFVPSLDVEDSSPSLFRVHTSAEGIQAFPRLRARLRFARVLQITGEDLGSAALTMLVGAPAQLVVVSSSDASPDALLGFAANRGFEDLLRVHLRVPLDDHSRLESIVADEFGEQGPDVVVDDTSQDLARGIELFDVLFPSISPAGAYLFLRWAWDHFILEGWLASDDELDEVGRTLKRAEGVESVRAVKGHVLEEILPRLLSAARARPDVVSAFTASRHWLEVCRGAGTVGDSPVLSPLE
jgi:hypothetical protein